MKPSRRAFLAAATAVAVGATAWSAHTVSATAAAVRFDQAAFDAALAEGRPILIEVSAPWCSVCRAQKAVLAELFADPRYARIVALDIDFDSQVEAVRAFGAQRQSTLILFAGGREIARSVGDASRAGIMAMLEAAL
jgi:thioredoxin 1